MAEWIGHLIANWPVWLVVIAIFIVTITWIVTQALWYGGLSPFEKKEWWQDREKRLQIEAKRRSKKLIMKAKKG